MNIDINRKNILEYLKEFKKSIPMKKIFFINAKNIDTSKLSQISDKLSSFFEKGILISPMNINKDSIDIYIDDLNLVKQFPQNLRPDHIMETELLTKTKEPKQTRSILLPSVMEKNSQIIDTYNKTVAYYLLLDGDKPIERFSKLEISMKQHGVKPDIGVAIMQYGNEITTKLEEIASSKSQSLKEWEHFKNQVLHSFMTAEKIGNRTVNPEEHKQWEARLIQLGILEKKRESINSQKKKFEESIRFDVSNKDDNDKTAGKQKIMLEIALQKNMEQMYTNTGMIPLGYKKDENGKLVRITPSFSKNDKSKNKLDKTQNSKKQKQELSR